MAASVAPRRGSGRPAYGGPARQSENDAGGAEKTERAEQPLQLSISTRGCLEASSGGRSKHALHARSGDGWPASELGLPSVDVWLAELAGLHRGQAQVDDLPDQRL